MNLGKWENDYNRVRFIGGQSRMRVLKINV